MATSLQLFCGKIAASTLATANQLFPTGTTAGNAQTTLIGTASGYGELIRGGASSWAALGSIGSPSGNGYLWDVTTLEGQTIIAGNWSAAWEGDISVGSIVADIHLRAYKYNAGVYKPIVDCLQSAKNVTTSLGTKTSGNTAVGSVAFGVGDKLYFDAWFDITTNSTGSGAATVSTSLTNSSTQGNQNFYILTPGYVPTLTDEIVTRGKWWFMG